MSEPDLIASSELVFISSKGAVKKGFVGIGKPYSLDDGFTYICDVTLGDFEPVRKIVGMDSLQAITLGLSFLKKRLLNYQDDLGWTMYYPKEEEDSDPEDPEYKILVDELLNFT